jgi:dimethylargininase
VQNNALINNVMTEFKNAILRAPCPSLINGLTTANLGKPDYQKALEQHQTYAVTLESLGLRVKVLEQDDNYPDSVFTEDVALCTREFAVITNPGADSRRGEIAGLGKVLKDYFDTIYSIKYPGTLEAGDVMMAGNHFFIGISERTNPNGAEQLTEILARHGRTASAIIMKKMLHLKTGVSWLENNNVLVAGELVHCSGFEDFNRIIVDPDESYAANSLWINGTVLVPDGFPSTRRKIEAAGYRTIALNVSEFRKVDGGLSCLSLRF